MQSKGLLTADLLTAIKAFPTQALRFVPIDIRNDSSEPLRQLQLGDSENFTVDPVKAFLAANIEHWYPSLIDHTPYTIFLPLTQKIALQFIKAFENLPPWVNGPLVNDQLANLTEPLNEHEEELRSTLAYALRNQISQFDAIEGCFVKLSGRSAKDVVVKKRSSPTTLS